MTQRPDESPALDLTTDRDRAQLERLATLGSMAAGAAHEVNNLLTPALAYAQLARNSGDSKMLRKSAERSVEGIESAARILAAILEFAQPDQNAGHPGGVREAVDASLRCLPRDPARDHISVTVDIDADLQVPLTPLMLQQVVLNLLINACRELRPRQGGTIAVQANATDNQRVQITVADDGPGIPEAQRERIFDPFYRGPSDHSATDGSGLGLAICRRVIENADGTIHAAATAGGGATFVIDLPAVTPAILSKSA